MAGAIVQFLLSAAVIAVAGSALTRYADAIADLTGLGRLLAGSIFLAVATSLPELSVDVTAVRMGAAWRISPANAGRHRGTGYAG